MHTVCFIESIWCICECSIRNFWNVVTVLLEYIDLQQLLSFKTALLPKLLALLANENAKYDDL